MKKPFILRVGAYLISIPARLKGMKLREGAVLFPGYRFFFTRLKGVEIGEETVVSWHAWFHTEKYRQNNPRIIIGKNCRIGPDFVCSAFKKIEIGDNTLVSYGVSIIDHNHKFSPKKSPVASGVRDGKEIKIEKNCFIGAHSFILKGVHLGTYCVVGANSVVTKSFPAYCIIAGNPAKFVKKNS